MKYAKYEWLPMPCPRCGSNDLEVFANVVKCMDCDFRGHDHADQPGRRLPEYMCDWREAIGDWNYVARHMSWAAGNV